MEFFLDSNGRFVFKPPLYNMDVNSEVLPYYVFKPEDIINLNTSVNSNAICNFLEVTAPIRYEVPELENKGYHIDFDSIKKFGIRYQALSMRYGNDARTLRLVACAEMTRMNGRAYTGSLSCSLRPELRLGYPIYVKHLDSYFYVTSINHSISFGTSATTDVGLEMRRDRMWDDGTVSGIPGKLLKSKVLRFREAGNVVKWAKSLKSKRADEPVSKEQLDDFVKKLKETSDDPNSGLEDVSVIANNILKEDFKRNSGILAGPKTNGLYEISDASISFLTDNATGDAVVNNQKKTQERMNGDSNASPDEKTTDPQSAETQRIVSNELVMISDNTVPYTDLNGYKHIGAFPYGANLKLTRGSGIIDTTDPGEIVKEATDATLNAKGTQTSTDTTPKGKETERPTKDTPIPKDITDLQKILQSAAPADTTNVANATRFSNTVKTTLNASPDEWSSMEEYPVASNSKLPFEVRD